MTIGQFYDLKIAREVDFGVYLESDLGDILLPAKYVPEDKGVGDSVHVFIHRDSEDRLLATTLQPKGVLGDIVALEVADIMPQGAFMKWGLEKDLFVPKSEQPDAFRVGQFRVVRICLDYKTDRLLGVGKLDAFLDKNTSALNEGEKVELLIYGESELGYKAIINQKYEGLLYKNEIFETVWLGDAREGYVRKVRDDGKIDLMLQPIGAEARDANTEKLLDYLKANEGESDLTDKSDPSDIRSKLGMSKKSFKKAIGALYKERLITLHDDGIKLV